MFKKSITPRVSETNLSGHIAHCAISAWFEEGWREIFILFDEDFTRPSLITANLTMDFLHEMYFNRDVELITHVKNIGTSSIKVHQEVHQNGRICVLGATTFVHFDYQTHTPTPILQPVRKLLQQHLAGC